jgi:hypothetical protein
MQLRATLVTDRADRSASLRSITVNMSDPVAERLAGEVWPLRVDRTGELEEFSLFIRSEFARGSQGFDEVRIAASAGTRVGLLSARLGSEGDFEAGAPTVLELEEVEVVGTGSDTLHFRLPAKVGPGTEVVEVRFGSVLLGNSASFRASVRDSDAGFWQRVDEGEATALVNSQKLTVLALEGTAIIGDLAFDSPVVTPNADGVNDELVARFEVSRVSGEQPVELTIFDLGGRIVWRQAELRADARGRYEMRWDGTGGGGERVAPGIYLARIDVDVDSGTADDTTRLQTVSVAY